MRLIDLKWVDYATASDRSMGIGASDANYLLDRSKWVKPQFIDGPNQLFAMKRGIFKVQQNILMSWGKVLEHHVVDLEYRAEPGYRVFDPVSQVAGESDHERGGHIIPSHVLEHKDFPFMRASPDRLVTMGEQVAHGLEIKTSWAYKGGWELEAYMAQLQWSMLVSGIDKWQLFISWQGKRPDKPYRNTVHMIEEDPIMQSEMLELAQKFWKFVKDPDCDHLPEDWRE